MNAVFSSLNISLNNFVTFFMPLSTIARFSSNKLTKSDEKIARIWVVLNECAQLLTRNLVCASGRPYQDPINAEKILFASSTSIGHDFYAKNLQFYQRPMCPTHWFVFSRKNLHFRLCRLPPIGREWNGANALQFRCSHSLSLVCLLSLTTIRLFACCFVNTEMISGLPHA